MKEINDIKATDLKALAQLDKDCIDLHLFPPPKTFIQMEVEGLDGTKVESRKMRSQSWHRNAYNMIVQAMTEMTANAISTSYGPGSIAIATTGGTNIDTSGVAQHSTNGPVGGAGVTDYGIVVGYEGAQEFFDDYSLTLPASNGSGMVPVRGLLHPNAMNQPKDVRFGRCGKLFTVTSLSTPFFKLFSFDLDAKTVRNIPLTGTPTEAVYSAEVSPCGIYIAAMVGSSAKIYKYNVAAGSLTAAFSATCSSNGSLASVSWVPNGDYVLFCGVSTSLLVKNNRDDTFTSNALSGAPSTEMCLWSDDGVYFAAALTHSPYLKIYKNNNNGTVTEVPTSFGLTNSVGSFSWSPDGKYLIAPHSSSPFFLLIKKTGIDTFEKQAPAASGVAGSIGCLEFSADGCYVAFRSTDNTYSKIGVLKNNNDDTFSLVTAGVPFATSYGVYVVRISRHPSLDYFLFATNGTPSHCAFSIKPALSFSAQNATTATYDATGKKMSFVMRRAINNNTPETATVKELGLITRLTSAPVMLSRDVLAEPLIVPPAYKLTVTYTMEMTFPA